MRPPWKPFKVIVITLSSIIASATAVFLIVTRLSFGQDLVLETVLQRISATTNGEVLISDIRSGGLLKGAKLLGIQVNTPDGSPLLIADSLEVKYSIRSIFRNDILLTNVTLWRPQFIITKRHKGEPFNSSVFFSNELNVIGGDLSPEVVYENQVAVGSHPEALVSEKDKAKKDLKLAFEDISLYEASLDLSYPVSSSEGSQLGIAKASKSDGDDGIQTLSFHGIEAHLDRLSIIDPEAEGIHVDVKSLIFEGQVLQDYLRVRGFSGQVDWIGDRITITAEHLGFPGTDANGFATLDLIEGSRPQLSSDFLATRLDMADLRWLQPDLPSVKGNSKIGIDLDANGFRIRWSGASFDIDGGELIGSGALSKSHGEHLSLEGVYLEASKLPFSSLNEYFSWIPNLERRIDGSLNLSGNFDSLQVKGGIVLLDPESEPWLARFYPEPTNLAIEGLFHLRESIGVTDLHVRSTPVDLALINRLPNRMPMVGTVNLDFRADGSFDEGVYISLDVIHHDPNFDESHILVQGNLRDIGKEDAFFSLNGNLNPFYISGFLGESLPTRKLGVLRGNINVEGGLSALAVNADLVTDGGSLQLESSIDTRSPSKSYRVLGEANNFNVIELFPMLPHGTILSGSLDFSGSVENLKTADIYGKVQLGSSRFANIEADTAVVEIHFSEGFITADTIHGVIGGVSVEGGGQLAMSDSESTDKIFFKFDANNLNGLHPLIIGSNIIARDTLSDLESSVLVMEGINPDTLPTLSETFVSGNLAGDLTLGKSFDNLEISGRAYLENGTYRNNRAEVMDLLFSVDKSFSSEQKIEMQFEGAGVNIFDKEFDSVSVNLGHEGLRGRANILLAKSQEESYRVALSFEQQDMTRTFHFDELIFRFPDERWNLGGPATVSWDPNGLTFRDLRLIRPGLGGMRLMAEGRFPFYGEADFDLEAENINVERIASILQTQDRLEGIVDLDFDITGIHTDPVMSGKISVQDVVFGNYDFERLMGSWKYDSQILMGELGFWKDSLQIMTINGDMPLDLSFQAIPNRIPNKQIDLVVSSKQLPLSMIMAPFESYQEVKGVVSGSVELGGTLENMAPEGQLVISEGEALIGGLGVRQQNLNGTLDWYPDGSVEVDATLEASGDASIHGTVTLMPISDPGLDLTVNLDAFQGIERQDITARLSGDFQVGGSYKRPVVSGELRVNEGTLFLEEFQRAAEIVDLAGPEFYEVIDTSTVDFEERLPGQNPFLRNIRMDNMTLTLQRDSWIRSARMDVELDGELQVIYDRLTQDLAMVGTLEAVRGSYGAFGRQFQVDDGTISFLGTPGVNPDLNIEASNRVRSVQGDNFTITAAVTGTLVAPRVSLTSDQTGLTEDDLLSYLYFGRPTYALTSGQTQAMGTAGLLLGSGVAMGISTFSNRLGSAFAQELGVDYLSITQQELGILGDASIRGTLGTTVVETGFYLADDFFVTLLLRPLADQRAGSPFVGTRFEWMISDSYTVESFFEDRFFRGRIVRFDELGLQNQKGLGLSIFREWSY